MTQKSTKHAHGEDNKPDPIISTDLYISRRRNSAIANGKRELPILAPGSQPTTDQRSVPEYTEIVLL
jgi:hypothetical protein